MPLIYCTKSITYSALFCNNSSHFLHIFDFSFVKRKMKFLSIKTNFISSSQNVRSEFCIKNQTVLSQKSVDNVHNSVHKSFLINFSFSDRWITPIRKSINRMTVCRFFYFFWLGCTTYPKASTFFNFLFYENKSILLPEDALISSIILF